MVRGPFRVPIVEFMPAQQAGEILTGLGGHPDQRIAPIEETNRHSIIALLNESLDHEPSALDLYKELLNLVTDASVHLEEYARGMMARCSHRPPALPPRQGCCWRQTQWCSQGRGPSRALDSREIWTDRLPRPSR